MVIGLWFKPVQPARLGQRFNMPMVHVVRRREQVDLLHSLGAEHVVSSHEPDFKDKLRDICHRLKVTLALDVVGGEMTDLLLRAMPRYAQIIVYGTLAGAKCVVSPN